MRKPSGVTPGRLFSEIEKTWVRKDLGETKEAAD
jgi:hypothetical protein